MPGLSHLAHQQRSALARSLHPFSTTHIKQSNCHCHCHCPPQGYAMRRGASEAVRIDAPHGNRGTHHSTRTSITCLMHP